MHSLQVVLDAYRSQWVWKIYHLEGILYDFGNLFAVFFSVFLCSLLVLCCIQIASLEEDKNAFRMTQSKELATLHEAENISCGKSEVDFIVSFFFYGKPDLLW